MCDILALSFVSFVWKFFLSILLFAQAHSFGFLERYLASTMQVFLALRIEKSAVCFVMKLFLHIISREVYRALSTLTLFASACYQLPVVAEVVKT